MPLMNEAWVWYNNVAIWFEVNEISAWIIINDEMLVIKLPFHFKIKRIYYFLNKKETFNKNLLH